MADKKSKNNHYQKVKEFHQRTAIDLDGFYDSRSKNKLGHHPVQIWARKKILKFLKQSCKPNDKILDIGCGRGDFSIIINQAYPKTKVFGVDFVEEMLNIGKRLKNSYDNVEFSQGDILNIPFPDKFFDISVCNNVLHIVHQNDQKKAIEELVRVTKKYIIFEIKNRNSIYTLIKKRKKASGLEKTYMTTIDEIKNNLNNLNFQLTGVKKIFFLNYLSPWMVLIFKKNE